jgi:hypothetical protein
MPKYRKKPVIVEAIRWWKNGDHPEDDVMRPFEDTGKIPTEPREGLVVRYFRHPNVRGYETCAQCSHRMQDHGWLDRTMPAPGSRTDHETALRYELDNCDEVMPEEGLCG